MMKKSIKIFCASNPAKLADALWTILSDGDFSNDVIFLPSRRAVRTIERMIVAQAGGAVILPKLVALGEASDELEDELESNAVSNLERAIVLSKMLSAANGHGVGANLPPAKDLIRMIDYLENENANANINWAELVDEKYAGHFQEKARFLDLAQNALPLVFIGRETIAQRRNKDIRSWIGSFGAQGKIIVCGSTGSVPATADLMEHIATLSNGYIILPGDIRHKAYGIGHNVCDPYYSELKFLERVGVAPKDVQLIDVGESTVGFFNGAFSNDMPYAICHMPCATRIEALREAEEAEVVAEIATSKSSTGKSVLIVSPDISAAQRLCEALDRRCARYDFSGGAKGGTTAAGRFILNLSDDNVGFYADYKKSGLFNSIVKMMEKFTDEESITVIEAIKALSDILIANGLELSAADLRACIADCLAGVSIRPPRDEGALISIVGTIESRMQTADVVILTGLNEGMFPALGYENPWLPRRTADQIGLPPPERKVSLMALDFINLSCGPETYWTRSRMSGGGETTESRFLSRVAVRNKNIADGGEWLAKVRAQDDVPYNPLDASPPRPPATNKDVYVTELELLIHNPYAFYARHVLRLKPKDDPDREPDARDFGILVHQVIERLAVSSERLAVDRVIEMLDSGAKDILGSDSVLFHFWHKRFVEIAPAVQALLDEGIRNKEKGIRFEIETPLACVIAGRRVKARADMVMGDTVLDIKTGAAPSRKQLEEGNMPQLPLEAHMLRNKEQGIRNKTADVVMKFLQLKNRDVRMIEYSGAEAAAMINAAVQKTAELFGRYSKDGEEYEYRATSDKKYKEYDDLARKP